MDQAPENGLSNLAAGLFAIAGFFEFDAFESAAAERLTHCFSVDPLGLKPGYLWPGLCFSLFDLPLIPLRGLPRLDTTPPTTPSYRTYPRLTKGSPEIPREKYPKLG